MQVFEWEDGFTPYAAYVSESGLYLAEYGPDGIERVSQLARRQEWDDNAGREDYAMAEGFASGDVDGVPVAWIDGAACELIPAPAYARDLFPERAA